MTQQPQPTLPYPGQHRPQAPRWRRWMPWVAYPATLLLGVAIGVAGAGTPATPAASEPAPTVTVTQPAESAPAETTAPTSTAPAGYAKPTKNDFTLVIRVLRKECFGSAGCSVSYRVKVNYGGRQDLDPSKTYELTYEVRGGEDGPVVNTLTITGDQADVPTEEHVSTSSKNTKLTAVVTGILD